MKTEKLDRKQYPGIGTWIISFLCIDERKCYDYIIYIVNVIYLSCIEKSYTIDGIVHFNLT